MTALGSSESEREVALEREEFGMISGESRLGELVRDVAAGCITRDGWESSKGIGIVVVNAFSCSRMIRIERTRFS